MSARESRLSYLKLTRNQLVASLPPPLRKTVTGYRDGAIPTRTIEDHAHRLQVGQWGVDAQHLACIKENLQNFTEAVGTVLYHEIDTIGNLKVLRAIGRAIREETINQRRPVKAATYRSLRRGKPDPLPEPEAAVASTGNTVTAEESLARYTEEDDPRWRTFFGYPSLGGDGS